MYGSSFTVVSLNDEAAAAGSGADRGQQQHCGAGGVSSSEEFAHIVSLTRTASDGYGLRLFRAGIILDVADTKVLEPSPPPTIEVVGGQRFWRVKRAVAGLQIISVEGVAVHGKAEVIAAMRAVKAGESATVTMQKPLDVMCDAGNGGGCRGGWFSHATALYFAARWGQVPEVAELVRAGANPDLPASLTSTVAGARELELAAPLHVAAYFGHAAVVALLLQARCGTERPLFGSVYLVAQQLAGNRQLAAVRMYVWWIEVVLLIDCNHPHLNDTMVFDDDDDEKPESAPSSLTAACLHVCCVCLHAAGPIPSFDSRG